MSEMDSFLVIIQVHQEEKHFSQCDISEDTRPTYS